MKFPKPYFQLLAYHFQPDAAATHICQKGFLVGAPSPSETSATRMGEALVLANMLVADRAAITAKCERGDGREHLLGCYGYKTNLCPHGISRGAADLAYFLREHWGDPITFHRPGLHAPAAVLDASATAGTPLAAGGGLSDAGKVKPDAHALARENVAPQLSHMTGVIAFIDIDRDRAQGHVDIWDRERCKGHEPWNARKILFWKLE